MDIKFVYNANRSQVEASINDIPGFTSTYIMGVDGSWSKKDFFREITKTVFDKYYANIDAILFLMEKIYGELTKDENIFYHKYFSEIRNDVSNFYFE